MFWLDLIFAFFFALVFLFLLQMVFRRKVPWPMIFVFIFFLFFIWAAGTWITPFGPRVWHGFWLPFFIAGLIFTLLLAAILPPRPSSRKTIELPVKDDPHAQERGEGPLIAGIFFWIVLFMMILAVIFRYAG